MDEIVQIAEMPPGTVDTLGDKFTIHKLWQAGDPDALLADVADRVRGVATLGFLPMSGAEMDKLPKLALISCFGVGIDGIDLDAARKRNIIVTNTPDVLNDCVADLAMALILACLRRVASGDKFVREGRWGPEFFALGSSLAGKRLGIVGLGRIGLALATRAEAFGMTIAYHNRNPRSDVDYPYHDSAAGLAAASEVLLLTCPGGAATLKLVNAEVLAALGKDGWLINISRGSVVDEAALVKALEDGVIAGAGLDVFADEPSVPHALFAMDNVVLQPHQGSGTVETRTRMVEIVADNLVAFFAGRPALTPVD